MNAANWRTDCSSRPSRTATQCDSAPTSTPAAFRFTCFNSPGNLLTLLRRRRRSPLASRCPIVFSYVRPPHLHDASGAGAAFTGRSSKRDHMPKPVSPMLPPHAPETTLVSGRNRTIVTPAFTTRCTNRKHRRSPSVRPKLLPAARARIAIRGLLSSCQ